MSRPLLLVRSWAVPEPARCQGRGCGAVIPTGERIHEVADAAMAVSDPGGAGAEAYLCGACLERVRHRIDTTPPNLSLPPCDPPRLRSGEEPW